VLTSPSGGAGKEGGRDDEGRKGMSSLQRREEPTPSPRHDLPV
jgi:hypothetical protein